MMNALNEAIEILGSQAEVARVCGVRPQAVTKWLRLGRLPRTEWTGETGYADKIAAATGGRVPVQRLVPRKNFSECEAA